LIEALGPTAAAGGERWLRDARNRREVDAALSEINRIVATRVNTRWADAGATP
jgi:hypothetical protein